MSNEICNKKIDELLTDSSSTSLCSSKWETVNVSIENYQNRIKERANGFLNSFLYGKWRRKPDLDVRKSCNSVKNTIIWLLGKPYIFEEPGLVFFYIYSYSNKKSFR